MRRVNPRSKASRLPILLVAGAMAVLASPADAQTKPIVSGGGSTWSQIAVDQWRADVSRFGLRINYQGVGSSAGRSFYINNQVDFAVSEIPFEPTEVDALRSKGKSYAYLPIVAGGTSFMYNLKDGGGQPITTLRLSSRTATGIFTGEIKNWSHPDLKAENPGVNLPDQPIVPVVRSDGSGTSAQFTAYMAKMEQSRWCTFARAQGIDCAYTSNYPGFSGSVGQSGSDGVANYVHSESTGRGAITYVETGYALQRGRPVAFMLNASGNYALPTSNNVSIALRKATLNADRTQNLDAVYTNPEQSAYPVSSYSYMIVPTKDFDTAKGDVLGRFMIYFACDGQRKADQLGYAPLPQNLVEAVFDAVRQVPGAPSPPAINECNNPTITGDGGTSNDTAAALSGGQSTSGAATAEGAITPTNTPGATSASGGTGVAGSGSNGAGAGGSGGGSGTEASGTSADASGATNGSSSGVAGSSGVVGTQALSEIDSDVTPASSATMAASALAVGMLVFLPPALGMFRPRRRGEEF